MLGAQAVEIGVFFGLTEHAGQLVARAFQSGGVGLNRLGLGDMHQRVARGSAHADICGQFLGGNSHERIDQVEVPTQRLRTGHGHGFVELHVLSFTGLDLGKQSLTVLFGGVKSAFGCQKRKNIGANVFKLGDVSRLISRHASGNERVGSNFDGLRVALFNQTFFTEEAFHDVLVEELLLNRIARAFSRHIVERHGLEVVLFDHALERIALFVNHVGEVVGFFGKALLAFQSDEYIRRYLDTRLTRPEAFPKADPAELAEELRTIREKGIAVSHGEYVPDAVGIGAPIYGIDGRISASVGIIAPYSRIEDDTHLLHLQDQVRHSAAELSYYMGHTFKQEK